MVNKLSKSTKDVRPSVKHDISLELKAATTSCGVEGEAVSQQGVFLSIS